MIVPNLGDSQTARSTLFAMMTPDELNPILERITQHQQTEQDLEMVRRSLRLADSVLQSVSQDGKFNTNVGQITGGEVHIGDRTYYGVDAEVIRGILRETLQSLQPNTQPTGIPTNLPYSGVVEFVGRDAVMSQLHKMLQQGHRVAVFAIAGMGGVGKTELALQYALKYQPIYPAGLCWLSARGVDVGTQIVQFGRSLLDLNPPEDVELVEQVKFCWRHWQSGEVLLVLDDVTDYAAIKPYLPPSTAPRFKVLITTRLRLGASVNQLELEVLDESAALALLESLMGGDRIQLERDCAQQLCAQLGYLPLGLELVGRYLARKPDLSLAAMQQRLQDKRLAALALRQTDADMTARSGVAAAFELSWETLSESAKSLGCLLSLFAAAPIPWSLVEQCLADRDPEDLEEVRDNELINLHLLQRTNPGTCRLHPLIRDFFQKKLEQLNQADELKQGYCEVMLGIAKRIPYEPTQKLMAELTPAIPHLLEVAESLTDYLTDATFSLPFLRLGRFYEGQGYYTQAEHWYLRGLEATKDRFGNQHLATATSLNDLAYIYKTQGRYSEAEPLYLRALDIRVSLLGQEHTSVAQSLNNLAAIYRKQGRYSEAEQLLLKVVAIRKKLLGKKHIHVAQCLDHLACLYYEQTRYTEAELLYHEAISIYKSLEKQVHPHMATVLSNQALFYETQGLYQEAERLYLESLSLMKKLRGEKHPRIGRILCKLANFYKILRRHEEAEVLYMEALEIYIHYLGEKHPDTVKVRENLECVRHPLP